MGDPDCVGVHFWARFNTKPHPPDYEVEISPKHPDANGKFWMTITLLCDHEIDAGIPGDPSDPPADGGEHGPVHPRLLRPRTKVGEKVREESRQKSAKEGCPEGRQKETEITASTISLSQRR